jgi:phthiodiolone/phenolphthiodiolone dimycocerosates ketoreductase
MSREVETAIVVDASRHTPLSTFVDRIKALEATRVVDYVHIWDQLTSWWPREMWKPDITPLAAAIPDIDSFPDSFALGALGAYETPDLGMCISSDAIRRGPAELMQTMLTISNLAGRHTPILQLGAGELKQCKPFGWKRSQGLSSLEDQFRYVEAFWQTDGPVDLEGNRWSFDQAWIGGAKGRRPRVWGLGGGPKILDLTTSYADGFATIAPSVWAGPDHAAEEISKIKHVLVGKGRDPDAFDFGIWPLVILHDEGREDMVETAVNNPLIRWLAAVFGRINQSDWDKEGIEPLMPRDWHYAMKLLPIRWTSDEVAEVIADIPREIIEKCFFIGTPATVAAQLQAYVDAGVTWTMIADVMPFVVDIDQAADAGRRAVEVCAILKGHDPSSLADTAELAQPSGV